MEERTIPFREDKSKVLVSAVIRHEEPSSIEPEWTGDRGDDYGEEVWFDLGTGSFLRQQTHRHLSYDINTGEDTSYYYPDRVDERKYSILDLPSIGLNIDSIDDRAPWCVAGPIADYLRNPAPIQAVESLTAIYRSQMGRDYGKKHASWNRNKSDSICILPGRCSSQLAEQILTDFANGQDDGLTTDGVGVTQALSKLDFPTGEISGETRSVIRSFQETLERLYDGGSCRTLNWYHPASGRLAMREDADEFDMYDVPLPFLVDEARSRPDRSVWWLSVKLYEPGIKQVPIRSVAKSIATEDGWIGVDRDRTVGDLAAMVADITPEMANGQPVAECSQSAVEAIPSEKPRDASVSVEYVTELEEAGALLNEDRNEIAVSWLPYDDPEILVFDCSAEKLAQACLKEVENGLSRGRTVDEILDELYCQNFVGGADGIHFKASFEGIRELSESGFFICSDSQKLINASSLRDLNAIVANQFPGIDLLDMAYDNAGSSLGALVSEKEAAVRLRAAAHKSIAPTAAHPEQESI